MAHLSHGSSHAKAGDTPGIIGVSAIAGALIGMLGAPLLGWGLLRHVPLGRVILVTALGTIFGAVAGEWLRPFNPYPHTIPGVIAGAFLGFALSGTGLRLRAHRIDNSQLRVGIR